LLDELLDARIFTQLPTRVDLELAIQSLIRNSSGSDSEDFINDLVVYKHVQSFQIATAEIFKRLPLMKVSDRLSDLAELLLEAVYTRVLGQAFEKFELPHLEEFETGFSILAYGKLGGLELSYSSDLDVVFLYNSDELPKSHILASDTSLQLKFYSYLVQQCLRYIDMPTSMGRLYEIDTRLRPSGNSGFLISSLSAFETYQSEEAWVWEHQALSRARVVLGSQISRDAISTIRKKILTTKINHATLKQDVLEMRERIREQYLKKNPANDLFHLKHSKGGMIDLEFLVQYLVLDNAQDFPEVIEFSDNIRQLEELARVGCLSKKTTLDLISAYIQIREQAHLQTLQDKKPLILKSDIKIAQDIVSKAWQQVFA
jgi:glutamate-ammonia-ligase adenylyltransferase